MKSVKYNFLPTVRQTAWRDTILLELYFLRNFFSGLS